MPENESFSSLAEYSKYVSIFVTFIVLIHEMTIVFEVYEFLGMLTETFKVIDYSVWVVIVLNVIQSVIVLGVYTANYSMISKEERNHVLISAVLAMLSVAIHIYLYEAVSKYI